MRSKLEDFIQKIYPRATNKKTNEIMYGKPENMSHLDALSEIVSSRDTRFAGNDFIKMVRLRLEDRNITPAVFMQFARWLYKQFSDKTCHKMSAFAPPLPSYDNETAIEEMLKVVEIDKDVPAVVCIQIVLQPLELP